MAREHLLLIDANEESAAVRELALRQAGYSVALAGSCDQAWHLFDESMPSLIVFDLANCSEPQGFLAKLKNTRGAISQTLPCVFLCEKETCGELPEELRPNLQECLVKPVYLRELISRVNLTLETKRRALWSKHDGGRSRYSGELCDLGVVDLLQTIDVCKKSGVVTLKTAAGDGEIWFKKGALIDASFGKLQAEAAVYRMIRLDQGTFGVQFKSVRRAKAMSSSTQQVLLEGLSRLDRWHRFCEQLPSLDEPLVADASYLKREGDGTSPSADVTALLRRFKSRKSIREVLSESRRSDLELLEIISEVYFCGALVPASSVESAEPRKTSLSGKIEQERPRRTVARTQVMGSDEARPRSISSSGRPRSISSSGTRPRSISSSEARPRSISSSGARPRSISSSGRPRAMTARMTSRTGPLSPPLPDRRGGRPRSATYVSMGSSRGGKRVVARTLVIPYGGDEEPTLPLDPPELTPSNRRRPNSATMVYHEDDQFEAQVPFANSSQRRARTRAGDAKAQARDAANVAQAEPSSQSSSGLRPVPKFGKGERSRRDEMLAQLEDSTRELADLEDEEEFCETLEQVDRRMYAPIEPVQDEQQAGVFGAIFGCVMVVALVLGQPFLVADHAVTSPEDRDHGSKRDHAHALIEDEEPAEAEEKRDLGAMMPLESAEPPEPEQSEALMSCGGP